MACASSLKGAFGRIDYALTSLPGLIICCFSHFQPVEAEGRSVRSLVFAPGFIPFGLLQAQCSRMGLGEITQCFILQALHDNS